MILRAADDALLRPPSRPFFLGVSYRGKYKPSMACTQLISCVSLPHWTISFSSTNLPAIVPTSYLWTRFAWKIIPCCHKAWPVCDGLPCLLSDSINLATSHAICWPFVAVNRWASCCAAIMPFGLSWLTYRIQQQSPEARAQYSLKQSEVNHSNGFLYSDMRFCSSASGFDRNQPARTILKLSRDLFIPE